MNAKISVFVICIKAIIYLLLYDVLDCIFKVNESQYITLFLVNGSITKLFSTDCVNIYFFQSIVNYLFKSVGLPHITYIVIQQL